MNALEGRQPGENARVERMAEMLEILANGVFMGQDEAVLLWRIPENLTMAAKNSIEREPGTYFDELDRKKLWRDAAEELACDLTRLWNLAKTKRHLKLKENGVTREQWVRFVREHL